MLNKTKVLFRRDFVEKDEEPSIAKRYFDVCFNRTEIEKKTLVIGRYSVLPFYKELEEDLDIHSSKLINSWKQHNFCADINVWYPILKDFTFKTWNTFPDEPGPFVLKGLTNSRKHEWKTRMFAKDHEEGQKVLNSLLDDSMIKDQGIVIRQYIPLNTYLIGLNDLPITEEFRCFIYKNKILSTGFYWSSYLDDVKEKIGYIPKLDQSGLNFVNRIAAQIYTYGGSCKPDFYVIDIAKTASGEWIVVELNDAQMSGLSENDPDVLWENLKWSIDVSGRVV